MANGTSDSPTQPVLYGRRSADFDGPPDDRLTFGKGMDRIVVYLIAGLTAWLCVSTMTLREQMAAMLERDTTTRKSMEGIQLDVGRHEIAINQIRLEAAERRR